MFDQPGNQDEQDHDDEHDEDPEIQRRAFPPLDLS
jgi:hypothetical protein